MFFHLHFLNGFPRNAVNFEERYYCYFPSVTGETTETQPDQQFAAVIIFLMFNAIGTSCDSGGSRFSFHLKL